MTCPYADRDGAYVLGSLSPSERREFEQHLSGCEDCSRAVRELAGLPGLLSRIDASVVENPPAEDPVPATLLPGLVREARRERRRRRVAVTGVAAAVVLAVSVPVGLSLGGDDGPPTASPSAAPSAAVMQPVGDVPVKARLALASVTWGTKMDLSCTYEPRYHGAESVTYALVVHGRDGSTQQVGTWRAPQGRTMRVTAATALRRDQIASVEVRGPSGRPVLELTG